MNPVNDARAMEATLKRVGFNVIAMENASQPQMYDAIRRFGDQLRGGGIGLFYFAGHGVQVKGRNFLIPVDAAIEREDEVAYKAVDAGQVLDKLESARNPLNIVILDACRNNPFARGTRSAAVGLAQMEAPVGTLIAFATAPGAEASDGDGKNGVYTQHLLEHIVQPGLKVEDVFKRVRFGVRRDTSGKQIPWENTSLEGDFYFVPPTVAEASLNPAAGANLARDQKAIEVAFWNTIQASTNPRDFKAYLERFPNGEFAALASARTAETKRASSAAAQPSAAARGFSFSRAEEQARQERDARQPASASNVQCAPARKRAPIRVEITEQFLSGLAVLARGKGGSVAEAIVARLHGAGLNVAPSGKADYVLRGTVTSQAGRNNLLALNELSISSALTLADAGGRPIATALHREESYAGADLYSAYSELASLQAANLSAQIQREYCAGR